jgi:PAS domain S-box-containing protein
VLTSVLQSSTDAIVLVDWNGMISGWNDSAKRMFGISRDKAVGEALAELFPADRQRDVHDMLLDTSPEATSRKTTVARRNHGSRLLVEACPGATAAQS